MFAAAATSTFGAGGGMLGGGMNAAAAGNGTVNPAFSAYLEKDPATGQNSHYQSITAMPAYRGYSFEVRTFLPCFASLNTTLLSTFKR